jgi:hypothetical protein
VGRIASAAVLAALSGVALAALVSVIPALLTAKLTPSAVLAEE